jgi:hypothetical protein
MALLANQGNLFIIYDSASPDKIQNDPGVQTRLRRIFQAEMHCYSSELLSYRSAFNGSEYDP